MSDSIKPENRGEGSSEKPVKPTDHDHAQLDESSSGEVKQDHWEENKESNQANDTDSGQDSTSQCDELLGDSIHYDFIQELKACLDRSGFKWAYLSTRMIENTLVVGFHEFPEWDEAEDLKSDLRLVMKGKKLPIKFIGVRSSWVHD
ncbi:hypothetical protein NCS52_00795500 [Fusarium sp. LHS14.1]|nr:hypothetical protein NCS52_00795500 [Fusarium sp. LHS14.1]